MSSQACIAMLLAGGEGRRLGVLTRRKAKPAVHFGGVCRIIDFSLSNCAHSGMTAVGVVTQYQWNSLHDHIGDGSVWGDPSKGGITLLASEQSHIGPNGYAGTADAVYANRGFIEAYDPEHVLVLSADHIYQMDYRKLLEQHAASGADATIAVTPVAWEEAHRFGIMRTDEQGRIVEFEEKPMKPKSNLASMGIYVFKWSYLREMLQQDAERPDSGHDFGKDVIPAMLSSNGHLQTYSFEGYWRDVGTIESLWEAHMDLLGKRTAFPIGERDWPTLTPNGEIGQSYVDPAARVTQSMIAGSSMVYGHVERSVISYGVQIGQGSVLRDCVVMPNAQIGRNVFIRSAIIGEEAIIHDGATIGSLSESAIEVVGDGERVMKKHEMRPKMYIPAGPMHFEHAR
ncbi:glucose-1-phosphate adenylyltransferase [Paenibacillus filicis]|uniref:Glucose-1-phosphate adenylyltransferase n=1 Tax=Paenibacillus gyeongsangnamensis TaxID=3388067 RepID=A0ABT4QH25_9BACL|nr:glucose-1-phosphate adenylyltransferase [Paenibacillus filicis]MCZ8516210.1 glucose-1-phosphate adenylyltransferase [Paenibacillus filicis]